MGKDPNVRVGWVESAPLAETPQVLSMRISSGGSTAAR